MSEGLGQVALRFLEDKWDASLAASMDEAEQLRYRSNLLGSDLRITNFGGGNTSSKLAATDPIDGSTQRVLWVKGSGGDLGSIKRAGFATLYLDRLLALESIYAGVDAEDAMVDLYPLLTFGRNPTVASIDTPLHGFLPFPHVDHLHPDWAIALAASANALEKLREFNEEFGHRLVWLPWQRPGFELGMMMKRAVAENPGCDGIVLGGHGLFTWGETQRECYRNTLTVIDQLGQFIERHALRQGHLDFGGVRHASRDDRQQIAVDLLPRLRGALSRQKRVLGSFSDDASVLQFVNSVSAPKLAALGTSCPDHFIRTKIKPLWISWDPASDVADLFARITGEIERYEQDYTAYYQRYAAAESPKQRGAGPSVVLVPGVGMFSFGKSRTEARITGEFYLNAIGVMRGAGALGGGIECDDVPQAGPAFGTEYAVLAGQDDVAQAGSCDSSMSWSSQSWHISR